MSDIQNIIKNVKRVESVVDLCLAGDLLAEYDSLQLQLDQLVGWEPKNLSDPNPQQPIRTRIGELREQMTEATVRFRFRALGARQASDLIAAHPPRKNDKGEEEGAWNGQTYPAALVAACAIEPSMTEKEAGELFDELSQNQRNILFGGAWRANNREVDIPFSEAAFAAADSTDQS